MNYEICLIGAAIADVMVYPVTEAILKNTSTAAERIRLTTGGDAINEAAVLAELHHRPMLITKLGDDELGAMISRRCEDRGIGLFADREKGLDTGINVVLVDSDGERRFVTNPKGSLRRLSMEDILPFLETEAFQSVRIASLASMFVSPELTLTDMEALFALLKEKGKLVCADSTKCKNGETVMEAAGALSRLDYFFPNESEAAILTGEKDEVRIADALLQTGLKCAVLKQGSRGCLVANAEGMFHVPAYPYAKCMDTTGAGDHFSASFQAGILEGLPPVECAAKANAVASLCVEQLGSTADYDPNEIKRRAAVILEGVHSV